MNEAKIGSEHEETEKLKTREQVEKCIETALEETENEEDAKQLIKQRLDKQCLKYMGPVVKFQDILKFDEKNNDKIVLSYRMAGVLFASLDGEENASVSVARSVVKNV